MQPRERSDMSLGDGEWEQEDTCDPLVMWASKNRGGHAAYDDGEVEHTGSGGGEGIRWREHDGNTGLPQLDIDTASANTKAGCTIGPAFSNAWRASTLEEAGTEAGRPFLE